MKRAIFLCFALVWPTTLFAGLTTAERKSQFEKAMTLIMTSATPKTPLENRERLLRDYMNAARNKAQAIELTEGHYYRSTSHEDASVAEDRALESCQLRFGKPCALIAVNEELVAENKLVPKDMPRLQYKGTFDISQIPIVKPIVKSRSDVKGYFTNAEPKAIAIHPWGRLFVSLGEKTSKDAQASALANCNSDPVRKSKDGPCFIYAVNNEVVLPERRLIAK